MPYVCTWVLPQDQVGESQIWQRIQVFPHFRILERFKLIIINDISENLSPQTDSDHLIRMKQTNS